VLIITTFLDFKARFDIPDKKEGNTPSQFIVQNPTNACIPIISNLLAHGINFGVRNNKRELQFYHAAKFGQNIALIAHLHALYAHETLHHDLLPSSNLSTIMAQSSTSTQEKTLPSSSVQ
jgi:hypothetical protein